MSDLVRVELEDGSHANVSRSYAKSKNLTVLDESPRDPAGRLKRTTSAREVEETAPPAGNAGRDEWVDYVVNTLGKATVEELDGMGRDLIRDTYSE